MICPNDIIKEASKKYKKYEGGYWSGQDAATHAMQRKHNDIIADKKLIKERLKGMALPLGAGFGTGLLGDIAISRLKKTGPRFPFFATAGSLIASLIARGSADKKYLENKGIKTTGIFGKVTHMTPEAKKKYLAVKHGGGWKK